MDIANKLLRNVPLFRHCSDDEIFYLQKVARISHIKKGQRFELKKINSFNIVINGVFEIEAIAGSDVVYLSPGSFFGNIPLTDNRQHGSVRAVIDASLLIINEEDLYRFFVTSYKALRGYVRTINRIGLEISDVGKKYFTERSRIVTIYSSHEKSGKSFFASLLGLDLSRHGKTIILDMSYSGKSVFDYLDAKITSPFSQKQKEGSSMEQVLKERIEKVDDNLFLFNIASGSKVKVDPGIISPILFYLSKEYKYIILDLSDFDTELRNSAFEDTDVLFTIIKKKEREEVYSLFDSVLNDGQRVYYVANEYNEGEIRNFSGGYILEKFNFTESIEMKTLRTITEKGACGIFTGLINKKRKALVLEPNMLESVILSGFIKTLDEFDKSFDMLYTSSFSYLVSALYVVSNDPEGFIKNISRFFDEEKVNGYLDITFPEKHIFKNGGISRIAADLCGKNRIEMYNTVPTVLLHDTEKNARRIFSTGYIKDLFEASFLIHPIFESKNIGGTMYSSGYPLHKAMVEDLYRTDVDEISFVSINNRSTLRYRSGKVLEFYKKYIDFLEDGQYDEKYSDLADGNYVIEVDEEEFRLESLLERSSELSRAILSK
ncbi:MAG: hypothetical protein CVV44_14920 [Spirochaetae bacterium HGW-Spirochaetae-1]|jgi:predicted acylesterase/phospholipase RssA|nr:MAG: hypothetical protein CVV44_14920 [Spirochaetae bacterium HGW-Spirochaetae-1]